MATPQLYWRLENMVSAQDDKENMDIGDSQGLAPLSGCFLTHTAQCCLPIASGAFLLLRNE